MKIAIIGGGPAGLYFALLAKKARPDWEISVYERNDPGDTFGFGVVFSDETLNAFATRNPESYQEITAHFSAWSDIDIQAGGETIRSGGHGFCGMGRKQLLDILASHARRAGVALHYRREIDPSLAEFRTVDLIVAADGVNSRIRDTRVSAFEPRIEYRDNRFVWLGTTKPLENFTFIFRANEHGLFIVHAYRFNSEASTWIVETDSATWRRAGLDQADEATTLAYCERLFAPDLDRHHLLANKSVWRAFPTVRCANWVSDNIVLMGDAAHTAHFSIGSGTKLAMEDAVALADALLEDGPLGLRLKRYQQRRQDEVGKLQHAAEVSLEWFEGATRYQGLAPIQMAMSLLSRSKRVTYDNLRARDPDFIGAVDRWFAAETHRAFGQSNPDAPPMFQPFRLRDMTLVNRVMVSPMCQYSATDGMPGDWHLAHLGSLAQGGAGLIVTEMTDIAPEARITTGCAGLWSDGHAHAWRRITDFVHGQSVAKIAVQLAHAGPKGATCLPWAGGYDTPLPPAEAWPIIAASAVPFLPHGQVPRPMTRADMDRVRDQFAAAVRHAITAGFDMIELHMAHGYLLSSFISPLTNRRDDSYGGSIANRMRYPLEIFDTVRAFWPKERPISVRISATDWAAGGLSGDDMLAAAGLLKAHGCDVIDVSAGQVIADDKPVYGRMFQTPFADRIRQEVGIPTVAVGAITTADQINTIVASGRADLVALARPHLADPFFTLHAAAAYGYTGQHWPRQRLSGRDQAYRNATPLPDPVSKSAAKK